MDRPLVSILCVTYNHEPYIAQAIEGFLMQKTSFPVEIVIGEDCSMDRTRAICMEYQQKYPEKIRLFMREKNLGAMQNHLLAMEACEGKYIANCEGDDYWTDPNKLQKQVDFLEAHPDYTISSHNVQVVYQGANKAPQEWSRKWSRQESVSIEDILKFGGGASGSLVFKKTALWPLPDWFKEQKGADWSMQILCAAKGKMKYFRESMGVYRIHDAGAYSAATKKTQAENLDLVEYLYASMDSLISALDKHFNFKYSKLLDISRNYNNLQAFNGYFANRNREKAKNYAKKLMPVLRTFPLLVILKTLLKLLVIELAPTKFKFEQKI